jgi:hypothetical protein
MTCAESAHEVGQAGEADMVAFAKARDPNVWSLWHDQYYNLIFPLCLCAPAEP